METSHSNQPGDIANEPYNGPGRAITSAGYMYVSHALAIVGGFIALGAVGAIASSQTHALKQWAEKLSRSPTEHNGFITQGFAHTVGFVSRGAEHLAEKVFGWGKKLLGTRLESRSIGEEKTAAALFAGGFGAVFGYIGSTFWGIAKGHKEGDKGKRQFERAKTEIRTLRAINTDLEKINDTLRSKYVEAATSLNDLRTTKQAQDGTLQVASDTPPAITKETPDHLQASATVTNAKHDGAMNALGAQTQAALV
ncbi:MAG: hypothetical protein V4735_09505 [Pseudomonadota bacterium]